MKLIITADLHYDVARSREPARAIAREICGLRAEALLVLGDAGGRQPDILSEALHLFDAFGGAKFFVAGNHDIWANPGECSLRRWREELPARCVAAGFHPLDVEPARMNGVSLVGTMGWYDYGYRPEHLGIPLRFYREKVAPGAASRLPGYEHLVTETGDVPDSAMRIGTRWMDGQHVRLGMDDVAFCRLLLDRFAAHLDEAARRSKTVIAGLHHVPFRELVPQNPHPNWAFAQAYMGSEVFGEALLACPAVKLAFCGHTHRAACAQRGHVRCIDVGSTYVAKRYEIVEL